MNEEKIEDTAEFAHGNEETEESIIEKLDPTKRMNRKQLREYARTVNRRWGNFTKPSLGARKRKRRALKKVGNKTRRLARA